MDIEEVGEHKNYPWKELKPCLPEDVWTVASFKSIEAGSLSHSSSCRRVQN